MTWLLANKRVALVVALTLAMPLALVLYAVAGLASLGLGFQDEVDRLEPRIARQLGAIQAEEQLLAAAESTGSRIENLVFPRGDDPEALSATLQKNVRGILSDAGLEVTDSRIETARREGAFEVIGLAVSVTGRIDALDEALDSIVDHTPLLLVTDISMSPQRTSSRNAAGQEQQVLSAKMSLQALVSVE